MAGEVLAHVHPTQAAPMHAHPGRRRGEGREASRRDPITAVNRLMVTPTWLGAASISDIIACKGRERTGYLPIVWPFAPAQYALEGEEVSEIPWATGYHCQLARKGN